MNRYKSEEMDSPPPSSDVLKKEADDQAYLPKRPERTWTKKRQSQIAQMCLIHEDKGADDIRLILNKKDQKEAMKKLKQPFKLQSLIRKDTKKNPLDMMGMIAPVNTGIYRGVRKSAYRKYNVHESPVVEHGLFPDRHTEEIDWILDKHDTSYKPNCFDTLPPYATQLARSTYDEPSPSTRLGRKRTVVPLPTVQKKKFSNKSLSLKNVDTSVKASNPLPSLQDCHSRSLTSSSLRHSESSRSGKASGSLPPTSSNGSSRSQAPCSTLFEDDDLENFDEFEEFDLGKQCYL